MNAKHVAAGLLLATFGLGCRGALEGQFVDLAKLDVPGPKKHPSADAVYLLKEKRGRFESNYNGDKDKTQWLHHDVLAVLTEDGTKHADYRVFVPEKAKLLRVRGRTITPDGRVVPLDPSQIYDAKSKGEKEDEGFRGKIFPMPQVTVGSVLEVEYVVEFPWVSNVYTDFFTGELPIEDYRVELEGPEDIYYRVISYNVPGAAPWKVEPGSTWRLSWQMKDVPTRKKGGFIGPQHLREPYWRFAVQAYVKNGQVYHRNSTWDNAVKWTGKSMYHDTDKHFAGWKLEDLGVDTSECSKTDTRCVVAASLAWVTDNLPMRGFKGWPGRKSKEVLDSKEASDVEKTRILHRILKDLGVEARFAMFHPYLDGKTDPDFPELSSMWRYALVVRAQGNLEGDLWIDPACEFCGPGELPYWLTETEALVVDYEFEKLSTKPKYTGRFEAVKGEVKPPARYTRSYALRIDEQGDADLELTIDEQDWDTQRSRQRLRERKPDDWEKSAEEMLEACVAQVKLVSHGPAVIDDSSWRSTVKMAGRATGLAVRDADELVVPLSFMKYHFDDDFTEASRTTPVVVAYPYDTEEVAEVEVPAGWRMKSAPEGGHVKGPFDVTVSIEPAGSKVIVRRRITAHLGRYMPDRYGEVRAAFALFQGIRKKALTFERVAEQAAR